MGQELRRSLMEKFGQFTIEYRPTISTCVPVHDAVILYFGMFPLVSAFVTRPNSKL
jgi:hypothetical protein